MLSATQLREIYGRASRRDDDDRKRRGHSPRATRCKQRATILTLLAHIQFAPPVTEGRDPGGEA